MSKIKIVIVVVLLVGGGGAGALFGLNSFYMAQIQEQTQSRLGGADQGLVDFLRVKSFLTIQKLSRAGGNDKLMAPLSRVPASTAGLSPEALINLLKGPHNDLVPVLEELAKKSKVDNLAVLSLQGRVLAKLQDKDKYGESMKGLPIVEECLAGVARDGFYELEKGKPPFAMAAAPIRDSRGNPAGCLLSLNVFGPEYLKEFTGRSSLQAAVFLRKQVVASTLSADALQPLASQLESADIVRFADPSASVPLLVSAEDVGYAARSVRLPSGTDGLHVSAILPLGDMIAPLAKAQQMLFIGVGALLVFGLLIGLLLSGKPAADKQAGRLRDAVTMLANGSTSTIGVESYSGVYKDLAGNIARLLTGGTKAPAAVSPESVSDILGKPAEPTPAEAGAAGTLDFESLLGGGKTPAPAEPPPAAEPEPPEDEAPELDAPTVAAPPPVFPPKEEPAMAPEPPPAAKPAAGGGPRVDVPSDLAGIFDDQSTTREVEPEVPEQAKPAFTPPAPAAPSPAVPDLDAGADDDQITSSDYKPDATVIAQVPDELLKLSGSNAAEAPAGKPSAMPRPPAPVMPPPPAPPSQPPAAKPTGEDAHFKEVFDKFVETKKQCGEPTAGLTLDRFAVKLRKNTTDLKARYKCRSVKFQVYVKNGKAALKATPVK